MTNNDTILVAQRHILARLPMSASQWRSGVKAGIYPAGIQISPRKTLWRKADIDALLDSIASKVQGTQEGTNAAGDA